MILEKETFEKFGYNYSELSNGSNKKVLVRCDYCKCTLEKTKKNIIISNKDIDKDACKGCRFKKREEVSLKVHGVKNSAQRTDVVLSDIPWDKLKGGLIDLYNQGYSIQYVANKFNVPSTSLKRKFDKWGVRTERTKERFNKTLDKKLGSNKSEYFASRLKENSLKKYGVKNYFQSREIKEKIIETNKKKYGHTHRLKNKDELNKHKKNIKEKYGVDNVFKLDSIKGKIKETNNKIYGYDYPTQSDIVKDKTRKTRIEKGLENNYKGMSSKEMAEVTGYSISRMNQLINKHGYESAIRMTPRQSSLEQKFEQWLQDEGLNYETGLVISGKRPDFRVKNVLFELDGLYWHSDACLRLNRNVDPVKYHKEKRDLYIKNNFKPLFFRSNEIENHFDIIKSISSYHLGINQRVVYARKCSFATTDKTFFNQNHLMMSGSGKIFALKFGEDIVSAIQVKRIKGNSYEISRFCSSLNTVVVGGFSRLLRFAEKELSMSSLTTFVDLRYGTGHYLHKMGFNESKTYLSFKWTDGNKTFHRMAFPSNSGYDNKLFKIWDCGQKKYVKKY